MNDLYTTAADFVAAEKLRLAAGNLQHLLKIQDEQVTLDTIVQSLERTVIDAHAGVDTDMSDILASQSRILDATFNFYIDKSKDAYSADDKMTMALRAQSQTVRTINMWQKLKHGKKNQPTRETN